MFGSGISLHRYFQEWEKAGFFQEILVAPLEKFDDLKGIGWEWQSVGGSMVQAPIVQSATGPNPTNRGKKGTKRSVLSDEHGLPLAVVLDGANRHDSKLLEDTLDGIVNTRPEELVGSAPRTVQRILRIAIGICYSFVCEYR